MHCTYKIFTCINMNIPIKSRLSPNESISNIGKGNYGTVSKIRKLSTNLHYAYKIQPDEDNGITRAVLEEMSVLIKFNSPYLLKTHEIILSPENVGILLPIYEGDLLNWIQKYGQNPQRQRQLKQICYSLLCALHDMF